MMDTRYDEVFMGVAGRAGGIEPLLDAFFGFLSRKTDFYVVHGGRRDEHYSAGFADGQAEKMMLAAFRRHPFKPLRPSVEEEKKTKNSPERRSSSSLETKTRFTDDGKQVPVGNGGSAATHEWTQTLKEATVYFRVPRTTRAKDIVCEISSSRLDMRIGKEAELVSRELYDRVDQEGSMWTLERDDSRRESESSTLVLTLEKVKETWWKSIFKDADSSERIDTTQVDSTKRMDEYDEQTQATIRKIVYDQRQKSGRKGEDPHPHREEVSQHFS